jgi:hypothetical protein
MPIDYEARAALIEKVVAMLPEEVRPLAREFPPQTEIVDALGRSFYVIGYSMDDGGTLFLSTEKSYRKATSDAPAQFGVLLAAEVRDHSTPFINQPKENRSVH